MKAFIVSSKFRIGWAAFAIAGMLGVPQSVFAQSSAAMPPHVPL